MDDFLLVILTIPLTDKSVQMDLYKVPNPPALYKVPNLPALYP